jgi:homoserine kinase type II
VHAATDDFPQRRTGRFSAEDVERRIAGVAALGRSELTGAVAAVGRALEAARALAPEDVGVIHGDLFRDNVRFDGDTIVAAIDWESASDGARVYDLAVTLLAWCYDDGFRWDLARAMCEAYARERPLSESDRWGLRSACLAAAARFTTTRITDFHLRPAVGERVEKDYRRFLARLEALEALGDAEVAERLGL